MDSSGFRVLQEELQVVVEETGEANQKLLRVAKSSHWNEAGGDGRGSVPLSGSTWETPT